MTIDFSATDGPINMYAVTIIRRFAINRSIAVID
ncbi:hypothetical protein L327_16120 [Yersinia pestis S3]|nr:hypothetical protein L327_16120 [Yersinia pestis S3]